MKVVNNKTLESIVNREVQDIENLIKQKNPDSALRLLELVVKTISPLSLSQEDKETFISLQLRLIEQISATKAFQNKASDTPKGIRQTKDNDCGINSCLQLLLNASSFKENINRSSLKHLSEQYTKTDKERVASIISRELRNDTSSTRQIDPCEFLPSLLQKIGAEGAFSMQFGDFPLEIEMESYSGDLFIESQGRETPAPMSIQVNYHSYEMCGAITYTTLQNGERHYVALIRKPSGWYKCNDAEVALVFDLSELLQNATLFQFSRR